ncbi:MAG: ATP-binding protein [bacterium]|jgi:two-component system phosphate regulon sensor histidine kinase PhoR
MRPKRLFWRIYTYFLIVTLGTLAATAWYVDRSLYTFHQDQVASDLLARARIIALELTPPLEQNAAALNQLINDLGRLTLTRVTVILPDGRVIADSSESPAGMENHQNRPEIREALAGRTGKASRYSDTLRRRLMYLAIPVWQEATIAGVVRVSLPIAVIDDALKALYGTIAFGGVVVATLFALLALALSRRITRPLEYMRQASEQFANGELHARIPVPDTAEMGVLAKTMNQMALQLHERVRTVALQHNEQRAVLANMMEGVLAVDMTERVLHINPAACRLLGLKPDEGRGRHILETIRNIELQEFLAETLAASDPKEREIVLRGEEERFIQLHGTALKDADGKNIGALVVMNDITRLKRLETMRRDFVANVSHELKTPITTLKGCVETLSDGAVNRPEEAKHFLDMMERHVNRLELMVEDLLALSRLEFESERGVIVLGPGSVQDVVARAVQSFSKRAEAKEILLVMDFPDACQALINAPLLEQAVGNLLDNAIKYSPEETRITVTGVRAQDFVEIRVTDQGGGIERQHWTRIFERFYRVDQARSRALGGTGLGLAIVKHIALAHHGSVSVESVPGQGSTFHLRIPRAG